MPQYTSTQHNNFFLKRILNKKIILNYQGGSREYQSRELLTDLVKNQMRS
jgi:hypothetical protein